MFLDETNSFLYVADTDNHRVQRFLLGGNGTGVTVAGGNGNGIAANQTYGPTGVYVSKKDGSIYVSERGSHRVQKWAPNATFGVTVAGRSDGTPGNGAFELNQPFTVLMNRNETWMYIADFGNNRVQRYPVH